MKTRVKYNSKARENWKKRLNRKNGTDRIKRIQYIKNTLRSLCGFFAVSLQFLSGFFTVSLLTYFGIYGKTFKNVLIYNLIIYTQNNSIIV